MSPRQPKWRRFGLLVAALLLAFVVAFGSQRVLFIPYLLVNAPILSIPLIVALLLMGVLLWEKVRRHK